MAESNRASAEGWLRYAHDLGLGAFHFDRSVRQTASINSTGIVSGDPAEVRPGMPSSSDTTGPAHPRISVAAAKSTSGSGVVPKLTGISLFDERIENDTLERIRIDIGPNCARCKLHKARTNIVFGVGNPKAELVFVGEGPGHDEDIQAEPFVGRAGKLLTQMIEAMGLRRSDVYICNVVKCRPPENRPPEKDEIITCSPYLIRQLDAIKPKAICCLGACSAQTLLNTNRGISHFRGEWFDYRGAKLMATYHPAYLLRNPAAKPEVWKDLQKIMSLLGLQVPKRK